jgi:hypothetical protein
VGCLALEALPGEVVNDLPELLVVAPKAGAELVDLVSDAQDRELEVLVLFSLLGNPLDERGGGLSDLRRRGGAALVDVLCNEPERFRYQRRSLQLLDPPLRIGRLHRMHDRPVHTELPKLPALGLFEGAPKYPPRED